MRTRAVLSSSAAFSTAAACAFLLLRYRQQRIRPKLSSGVHDITILSAEELLRQDLEAIDRIIMPELADEMIACRIIAKFTGAVTQHSKKRKVGAKKQHIWQGQGKKKCVVLTLPPSGWKGVVRNVPRSIRHLLDSTVSADTQTRCIVIRKKSIGRILLLDRLSYRGNIGTIVRSAVQANVFEAIYCIGNPNSDEEISYYSMMNAPLIEMQNFGTVEEFFSFYDDQLSGLSSRPLVAVELRSGSVDLWSEQASDILAHPNLILVLGAEDKGVHESIMQRAQHALEIPSMSASINVSMAFMAALSVMCVSDSKFIS